MSSQRSYGCKAVEGMLSYQMEKDTIDGKKELFKIQPKNNVKNTKM